MSTQWAAMQQCRLTDIKQALESGISPDDLQKRYAKTMIEKTNITVFNYISNCLDHNAIILRDGKWFWRQSDKN